MNKDGKMLKMGLSAEMWSEDEGWKIENFHYLLTSVEDKGVLFIKVCPRR